MSDQGENDGLADDLKALPHIFETLDRLEAELDDATRLLQARNRGYFSPDEDDQVRRMQLSYLTCRRALYNVIERCEDYESEPTLRGRLSRLIVGLAAALTLYATSLKLVQRYEDDPLVRKKLNEPDLKFGLDADSFEEILGSFTSLGNYRRLGSATRYWHRHRRHSRELGLEDDPGLGPLCEVIRVRRPSVRKEFMSILRHRLHRDRTALWRSVVAPLSGARYGVQSLFLGALSGVRTVRDYRPALDAQAIGRIHVGLRPGDVLLVRSESKLGSALLPGFWGHAALYAGNRDDLGLLGVRTSRPLQGAAACVVEAIPAGVQINPLEQALHTDHLVVLRPRLSDAEKGAALEEALSHVGKPYDFEFDFNVTTRLVCTELVYRSYHRRGDFDFPLTKRLGRYTLTCDDIVGILLTEGSRLPVEVVTLALQGADGKLHFLEPPRAVDMLRAIHGGFRPKAQLTEMPA